MLCRHEQSASMALDAEWMEVLWHRGLSHINPQVQRVILRSFLGGCWTAALAGSFSEAFVVHHLLHAATLPQTLRLGECF